MVWLMNWLELMISNEKLLRETATINQPLSAHLLFKIWNKMRFLPTPYAKNVATCPLSAVFGSGRGTYM